MSYLNDFIKPTDYGAVRKDINRILSLIHDITAQEPEDQGLQERICISSGVKLRTTTTTFGAANLDNVDILNKEAFVFRKRIPTAVYAYDLVHNTTGTLTFTSDDTKFGGAGTFDGSSYITIDDHTRMDIEDISIGGWFYLPATDAGDTASQNLIYKGGSYSVTIDPHATAANQIRASMATLGTATVLTSEAGVDFETEDSLPLTEDTFIDTDLTGTFTPDAWNHIWITRGVPNFKLYIDKVVVDSTTDQVGSIVTNTDDLIIG